MIEKIFRPVKISKENFATYGDLISTNNVKPIDINNGYAKRFDNLANINTLKDQGKTIVIATHDLNTLADRFDEVICLNRHVCAQGSPDTAFTPAVLEELYGPHPGMFLSHSLGHHDD